jgi:hypothetical protein
MSSSRCCFCQRLPAISKRKAGKPAKCPLCHEDLIVAWRTGDTYRLETPTAGPRRPRTLAVIGSAAALMFAAVMATAALVRQTDTPDSPAVAPAHKASVLGTPSLGAALATPAPVSERATDQAVEQPAVSTSAGKAGPAAPADVAWTKAGHPGGISPAQPAVPIVAPTNTASSLPSPWSRQPPTEGMLCQVLRDDVPELNLGDGGASAPKNAKEAIERIKSQADAIIKQTKDNPDGFVQHLKEKRPDLAGLPWRMGKDCLLPKELANTLQAQSLAVREALDLSVRKTDYNGTYTYQPRFGLDKDPLLFWSALDKKTKNKCAGEAGVGTLNQFLMAENPELRQSFVDHVGAIGGPIASVNLAKRAVFDLDADVRAAAVGYLKKRPTKEYADILLEALRYPWAPVSAHAAEALVNLEMVEAVPHLVNLLSEPDPGTPFLQTIKGQPTLVVVELVRVNHLRNCMLCHAPSTSAQDLVRAPVPTPGQPLPPSARAYYQANSGETILVRADVTYLKQDFSVMQSVDKAESWPVYQRFDYLRSVRPLIAAEKTAFEIQQKATAPQPLSEHKQAILYALRGLTRQDAGNSIRAWRVVVRAMFNPQTTPRWP